MINDKISGRVVHVNVFLDTQIDIAEHSLEVLCPCCVWENNVFGCVRLWLTVED